MAQTVTRMDPLDALLSLETLGIKFGLGNIQTLCEALGRPERSFRSALIAGTNGKGSVTAMAESALRAAGRRTARYTSPHLVHLEERFVIAGQPVTRSVLRRAVARVLDMVTELVSDGRLASPPTFFEACTAAAFLLFEDAGVDIAVLEVGLGGRLDATNCVAPVVSAITSVSRDHEALLGGTLGAIASEKAGVMRAAVPTVVGRLPAEALAVVAREAEACGARLVHADREVAYEVRLHRGETTLTGVRSHARHYGDIPLDLRGRHQAENAAVAIALLEILDLDGWPVPPDAVVTGLSTTTWRGRLELVRRADGTGVWLDAGHNAAGAETLAAYLADAALTPIPIVFGAMADKDLDSMLRALGPVASHFVFTRPPNARAAAPADLVAIAARVAPGVPAEICDAPASALSRAWCHASTICATGSIFLIGALLSGLDAVAHDEPV